MLSRDLAERYDFEDDGAGEFDARQPTSARSEFLIGRIDGSPVACGAFRPLSEHVAEIKRMYVRPEFRGRGYSKMILTELECRAAAAGYTVVRLETGNRQPEAISLYERAGYRRIPCFGSYVESQRSVCFEKVVEDHSGPGASTKT